MQVFTIANTPDEAYLGCSKYTPNCIGGVGFDMTDNRLFVPGQSSQTEFISSSGDGNIRWNSMSEAQRVGQSGAGFSESSRFGSGRDESRAGSQQGQRGGGNEYSVIFEMNGESHLNVNQDLDSSGRRVSGSGSSNSGSSSVSSGSEFSTSSRQLGSSNGGLSSSSGGQSSSSSGQTSSSSGRSSSSRGQTIANGDRSSLSGSQSFEIGSGSSSRESSRSASSRGGSSLNRVESQGSFSGITEGINSATDGKNTVIDVSGTSNENIGINLINSNEYIDYDLIEENTVLSATAGSSRNKTNGKRKEKKPGKTII